MIKIPGVRQRSDGTYQFTVSTGRASSKGYGREYKTYEVTKKMTPKQLEEHLKHEYLKFKQEVLSGEYITPEKMTFEAFTKEWSVKFAERKLSETTYMNRQHALKNHIVPVIGFLRLDQIKTMTIVNLLDNLKRIDGKEGELSDSSKEDVYKALKSVYKYAVQWKVVSTDPMIGVEKPQSRQKVKEEELNVYEPAEIEQLFIAAEHELYHWRVFITLALAAGLRRGELLGLEWSRVDFEKKEIDISTTIVKGRKGPVIKDPKSKASKRLIALDDNMMKELELYRKHWVAEKLLMGAGRIEKEREWIFCNEDGTHFYPDTPSLWWRRFTERAELRHIRLHDLRHTSATLMIAQKIHAKVIAERLGHSRISVSMDTYGHLFRSADHEAALAIGAILPRLSKEI